MNIPADLKYTQTHEWIRVEGKTAFIGISDHAQEALGDIVYVEIPENGDEVSKGGEALNIESVKAAAPVNSPVSGTICEVNTELDENPESINKDPYTAYLFAVEMSDISEIDSYMNAEAYGEFLKKEDNE